MAYEIPDFTVGVFPADIDMSQDAQSQGGDPTFQFTGVCVYTALSTEGAGVGGAALIPPASTSSPIIGVLQNNPNQGEAGQVVIQGVTKAVLGGSVSIGDLLMSTAAGKFVRATSTNYAVAVALETGVNGDIAAILLQRNGKI